MSSVIIKQYYKTEAQGNTKRGKYAISFSFFLSFKKEPWWWRASTEFKTV